VLILGLLALRPAAAMSRRERAAMAMIGLAFFLVRTTASTASLWLQGREWDRHLAALDHLPRGARLVTFIGEPCGQPWAHRRANHLPGFAIARRAAFSNDQWRLGGATPLRIVAPDLRGYDSDPSQMVLDAPCEFEPGFETIAVSLANLPHARFDYVWLITPPPFDRRLVGGMQMVWRNETDALYRIDNHRLSVADATH